MVKAGEMAVRINLDAEEATRTLRRLGEQVDELVEKMQDSAVTTARHELRVALDMGQRSGRTTDEEVYLRCRAFCEVYEQRLARSLGMEECADDDDDI